MKQASNIEFGTKVYSVNKALDIYVGVVIKMNGDNVTILDNYGNRWASPKIQLALTPREAYAKYRLALEENLKRITKEHQEIINKLIKCERNCDE